MKNSFRLLSVAGLSALLAVPALAQGTGTTPPPSRERGAQPERGAPPARDRARDRAREVGQDAAPAVQARVGQKAPNFTLQDTKGNSHSLKDFEGKIVVLQWINPECPYCVRVMRDGQVKNAAKEAKKMVEKEDGVVWLLINSTSHMPAEGSAKYLTDFELPFPALVDRPGIVGRMYGARTTPHMYVIDAEGILRYEGAIDDDPRGNKARDGETVMNYVTNAIRQMTAGETVSPANTRPWGCTVKYAAADTPSRGR
jgi:peroxiredoxin